MPDVVHLSRRQRRSLLRLPEGVQLCGRKDSVTTNARRRKNKKQKKRRKDQIHNTNKVHDATQLFHCGTGDKEPLTLLIDYRLLFIFKMGSLSALHHIFFFFGPMIKVSLILTCKTSVCDIKHELGFVSIFVLLPALVRLVQRVLVSIQTTL